MPELRSVGYNVSASNVTLTTTTEKVIISSGPLPLEYSGQEIVIIGWAQLTTGTDTTAVKPKIRRGTAITGTLVNEANSETVKAAAGSTEPFFCMAAESRANENTVEYSFCLEQVGASADGTALQAGIIVLLL